MAVEWNIERAPRDITLAVRCKEQTDSFHPLEPAVKVAEQIAYSSRLSAEGGS